MKKNAKTANVAGQGSVLVVKSNTPTEKKFDAKNAQTVAPIGEEKTDDKPQEQTQPVTVAAELQTPTPTVAEATTAQEQPVIKRIPTMQEMKESVSTLYYLQEKHSQLLAKRASLNKFAIAHERDNAEIIVTDATGEEFVSRSPKTIAKLIEFWKIEFEEALTDVENQLKDIFLGAA